MAIYYWEGRYTLRLVGTELYEDTLRIISNYREPDVELSLVLPTLCITYADVNFQNNIGGHQNNYPDSQKYGPSFFDPPVEIAGEQDIKKFTYIRGAEHVEIGPKETVITFSSNRELVIPRLRIDQKNTVEAYINVPNTRIKEDEPLQVNVHQYADGRLIGGVSMEKRHPKWKPPVKENTYELWLRVIDGISSQPLPEKRVNIWQWDPKVLTAHGKGGFRLEDSTHTDGNGCIQLLDRPAGELKAYTVNLHDRRAVARCLRPLAGQKVRLHMRVWPLTEDTLEYTWQAKSKLESLSQLTMHSVDDIQQLNPLQGLSELIPGTKITLPCYAASYRMEHWDTFDWIGKAFGYQDARGLAKIMRLKSPLYLDTGKDIELPDWHFFYARENDTLEQIDSLFGLPQGSSIAVGRVYHPDPRLPYTGETIAIPTASFAIKLKKMRK